MEALSCRWTYGHCHYSPLPTPPPVSHKKILSTNNLHVKYQLKTSWECKRESHTHRVILYICVHVCLISYIFFIVHCFERCIIGIIMLGLCNNHRLLLVVTLVVLAGIIQPSCSSPNTRHFEFNVR